MTPRSRTLDAAVFDLDGVITDTAQVHARAWALLFNELHAKRQDGLNFSPEGDYALYLDGKPRYEGVQSYLTGKGVSLPWGDLAEAPGFRSVCALGNRKNAAFLQILEDEGIGLFSEAVECIRRLREEGVRIALATSSRNGRHILAVAGIEDFFDLRIDGLDAAERGLRGKPAPDVFCTCALELGSNPDRAVVFEDAVSGVQAGASGAFELVVGVDRVGDAEALMANGADVVIEGFKGVDREWLETVELGLPAARS